LIFTSATGTVIQQFSYDDDLPWPTAPDGGGYALVLRNPGIPIPDHGIGSNWAASALIGGAPGVDSEVGFVGDVDADLDGDGLSAFLEYALGSSDSVSGDSTIAAGFEEFPVAGVVQTYLTVSFLKNQHAQNAFNISAQIGNDLVNWDDSPEIILVSEINNNDGTSTVTYRSATAIGDSAEGREFARVIVSEAP